MKSALFIILVMLSFESACKHLSNSIDELHYQCGDGVDSSKFKYFKILDKNNNPLSIEFLNRTKALLIAGDKNQTLKVTERSCVETPKTAGTIVIQSPANNQAMAIRVDAETKEDFIYLEEAPILESSLNCPDGDYIANQYANNVWDIKISENTESTEIDLKLINEKTSEEFSLYKKQFGDAEFTLPNKYPLDKIKEGQYRVEATAKNLANNSAVTASSLNNGKKCLLSVVHSNNANNTFQDLPKIVSPKSKISSQLNDGKIVYTCFEKRLSKQTVQECGSSTQECDKQENFSKANFIAPEESGVYDLLHFTKDGAGNQSPVLCETLVVNGIAPSLDVKWINPNIDPKMPFLDLPYTTLKAQIITSHENVSKDILDKGLQCKVQVITRDVFELTGSLIRCVSGRCNGMNMDDFVPCDPETKISIGQAWSQKDFGHSKLRLIAKTSDGIGNAIEKSAFIAINDSKWFFEKTDDYAGPTKTKPSDNSIVIPNEGGEIVVLPPKPGFKIYQIFKSNLGKHWLVWNGTEADGSPNVIVTEFKSGLSTIVREIVHHIITPARESRDASYSYLQLQYIDPKQPTATFKPRLLTLSDKAAISNLFCPIDRNSIVDFPKSKTTFLICGVEIYQSSGDGKWSKIDWLNSKANGEINEIIKDTKDRLLIFLTRGGAAGFLGVIEPETKAYKEFHLDDVSSYIPLHWYFFTDNKGQIYRGLQKWDADKQTVADASNELLIYPENKSRRFRISDNIFEYMDVNGTFAASQDNTVYLSNAFGNFTKIQDVMYFDGTYRFRAYGASNDSPYYKLSKTPFVEISRDLLPGDIAWPYINEQNQMRLTRMTQSDLVWTNYSWKEVRDKNADYVKNDGTPLIVDSNKIFSINSKGEREFFAETPIGARNFGEDSLGRLWFEHNQGYGYISDSKVESAKGLIGDRKINFVFGDSLYVIMKDKKIFQIKSYDLSQKAIEIPYAESPLQKFDFNCPSADFTYRLNSRNTVFHCPDNVSAPFLIIRNDGTQPAMISARFPSPIETKEGFKNGIIQIGVDKKYYVWIDSLFYRLDGQSWTKILDKAIFNAYYPTCSISQTLADDLGRLWIQCREKENSRIFLYQPQ